MANLNTAISPSPVVTVRNKDGTTASGYTGNVTMALSENPTNATLGGTVTVAAAAGVATFSNLTLNRSGKGFKLRATGAEQSGVTPRPTTSAAFTIPTRCVFTIQPVGTAAPDDIMTPFQVTIKDTAGNTDTAYNGEITVALYTGAGLGILGGFTTRLAVSGVADFSGMSIDSNGTYSLRATADAVTTGYSPAPVISNSFTIPYSEILSIGVEEYSATWWGFNSGNAAIGDPFGTATPSTVNGSDLWTIYQELGSSTKIIIEGTHAATFFTQVVTSTATLLTAAASFSTDNDGVNFWSIWDWGSPIFNTAEYTTNATFT
jgi:hypothetical protein